jgi:hypothetical protein
MVPTAFTPSATYSRVGDLLKVYIDDEPCFARQLTPSITVLIGMESGGIVGVKISDVAAMVNGKSSSE